MLEAIFVSTFAAVWLFIIGLTMKGEAGILRERIETLRLSADQDIELVAPELAYPFGERIIRPALRRIAGAVSRFFPANAVANADKKLKRAGNPWRLKPLEFIGLKVIVFVIFLGAGVAYALLREKDPAYQIAVVIIGLIIGIALPDALLDGAIRKRHSAIRRSLPDSLDLLVVCAEAGLGFDGAVSKLVERARGPLAEEFAKALQDMSVGRSRMEALEAMAARVDMPEVTTFVAAVHQSDVLGVSIAHVLRVQAESIRVNRNLRARETAGKLPVKMLFPLVFFIFPALFVVLLAPAIIAIMQVFNVSK